MKKITYIAILSLIVLVGCGKSEIESLTVNNLEPNLIYQVLKIDSINHFQNPTYNKVNLYINRSAISSWDKVESIMIKRSMGSTSNFSKDFSFYLDHAVYPSGPAWVVLHLRKDSQNISAPSDTFYFNVP